MAALLIERPAGGGVRLQFSAQPDADAQLLPEFAVQCVFRGFSPGSTLPPGNSHMPANCGGAVRRATSSRAGALSESSTAPPTTLISPVTAPVYGGPWFRQIPRQPPETAVAPEYWTSPQRCRNQIYSVVTARLLPAPRNAERLSRPPNPLSKSRQMTPRPPRPAKPKAGTQHLALAIVALAMGGFGIGVTEFAMMGLLKEVEQGLNISTPEAGHLISAYALGVVIGAPLLAAVGAKLPRKHLALGLMLFFSVANLTSFIAPDYGTMLVSRFAAGLPHGAFFGVAAVIAASLVAPTKRGWAISMVMAGLTVSNVIGVPFATWLGQTFGWRLLFVLVGVIGTGDPRHAVEVRSVPEAARRRQHPPGARRAQAAAGLARHPHRHRRASAASSPPTPTSRTP